MAARAIAKSFSMVDPEIPIAAMVSPSLLVIGKPPAKVIKPPLECSMP